MAEVLNWTGSRVRASSTVSTSKEVRPGGGPTTGLVDDLHPRLANEVGERKAQDIVFLGRPTLLIATNHLTSPL